MIIILAVTQIVSVFVDQTTTKLLSMDWTKLDFSTRVYYITFVNMAPVRLLVPRSKVFQWQLKN